MQVPVSSVRVVLGLCASVLLLTGCALVDALKPDGFETPIIGDLARMTTDTSADEINPVWSPDASTLLYVKSESFASQYDIWQLDLHNWTHSNLTESFPMSALSPTWSPDGRRLAFFSRKGAEYAIWVMEMSSDGERTKLTNNKFMDIFPSWSPDGTKIAFVSDRSGEAAVWTMNIDGSDAVRLTEGGFGDLTPAWNPEGTSLAFSRRVQMELNEDEKDDYYKALDELSETRLEGEDRKTLFTRLDGVLGTLCIQRSQDR